MEEEAALTEQETAVYDRQIRVWGVQAQRRLSKSRVLVVGLSGVTAELCKNLVLAGIGSLGVLDLRRVSGDSGSFLASPDEMDGEKTLGEIWAASLRDFNPMVDVTSLGGDNFGESLVQNYDVVILNRSSLTEKKRVNEICRKSDHKVAFYTVNCIGSKGEIFVDLQSHNYTAKVANDPESKEMSKMFPSFEDVLSVRWSSLPKRFSKLFFAMRVLEEFEGATDKHASGDNLPEVIELRKRMCEQQGVAESIVPESLLKELCDANGTEFPPVSAILGGILGQEVVKALSAKGDPLKSFFYFDSEDGKGNIEEAIV